MGKESVDKLIKENLLVWKQDKKESEVELEGFKKSSWTPYVKYYLEGRTKQFSNLLQDIEGNKKASITIKELFGEKGIFDNPKPVEFLTTLMNIVSKDDDLILDFFSGSGTTAHAVMKFNSQRNTRKKYIMIQWPEECDINTAAYKAGYRNICEIGKERIRRAGKKIKEKSPLTTQDLDTGFRVFKCESSNYKDVAFAPKDYSQDMLAGLLDNIKEDRTPEDLLFQVMLDLGIPLSSKIEESVIAGKKVFKVEDNYLIACFDSNLTEETIKAIAQQRPYYFVMRDSSMANDSVATNFEQIFATYSPETDRKVL